MEILTKLYIIVNRWGKTAKAVKNKMRKSNIVIDKIKLLSKMSVKSKARKLNMNR